MERALMMVVHSLLIGLVLYLLMVFALRQSQAVAETRSVFIAGLVLVYMVAFGHGLPNRLNGHLKM